MTDLTNIYFHIILLFYKDYQKQILTFINNDLEDLVVLNKCDWNRVKFSQMFLSEASSVLVENS